VDQRNVWYPQIFPTAQLPSHRVLGNLSVLGWVFLQGCNPDYLEDEHKLKFHYHLRKKMTTKLHKWHQIQKVMQFPVLRRDDHWTKDPNNFGTRSMFSKEGLDLGEKDGEGLQQVFYDNLQYAQDYLKRQDEGENLNCNRLEYKLYHPNLITNHSVVKEQHVHADFDPETIMTGI